MDLTNYTEEECKIFNAITTFRKKSRIAHPIMDISREMTKRSVKRVSEAISENSEVEYMAYIERVHLLLELEKFDIIEKQAKEADKYKAGNREYYFLTTEGAQIFRQGGFVKSRAIALEKKKRRDEEHEALLDANRIAQDALEKAATANDISRSSSNWSKGAVGVAVISALITAYPYFKTEESSEEPQKTELVKPTTVKEAPSPIGNAVVQERGVGQFKNETRKSGDSARASQ